MSFRKNEDGVSPVIGVILIVAITVILAAVTAAFILEMKPPEHAPQASLRLELNETTPAQIDLRHQGGDMINWSTTTVIQSGATLGSIPTTGNLTAGHVFPAIVINGTTGTEIRVTVIDKPSQRLILDAKIMP